MSGHASGAQGKQDKAKTNTVDGKKEEGSEQKDSKGNGRQHFSQENKDPHLKGQNIDKLTEDIHYEGKALS